MYLWRKVELNSIFRSQDMNNFVIFIKFVKFSRSMMESFPDFLLWAQATYQTFSATLIPRLTHGGTRSISLPRWYIKNIFKMQNFEQKLSFFSLISKIHMSHVTNLTIIIFNQLLVQICIFGENLKLIALFFPKL